VKQRNSITKRKHHSVAQASAAAEAAAPSTISDARLSMDARVLLSIWFAHGKANCLITGGPEARNILSDRSKSAMKDLVEAGYVLASQFSDDGWMQYTGTDKCLGCRLPFNELKRLGRWSPSKPNPASRMPAKPSAPSRSCRATGATSKQQRESSGKRATVENASCHDARPRGRALDKIAHDSVVRSEEELRRAILEHRRSYPRGNWPAANERVERARSIADAVLHGIGRWPSARRFLGNDAVLALLKETAASGCSQT